MATKYDNDPEVQAAAAVRRTAASVEPLAKSLAADLGLMVIPDTWYHTLAVALRASWVDGNDYAHEAVTGRFAVSEDFVDNSDEPTVRVGRRKK